MARLKRANDGHLYILAGQSQGTWQVSEKGEVWLRQHNCTIPRQDEFVNLDPGSFRYLRDKAYIYTHGIEYDHIRQDNSPISQAEPVAEGLPLLLRLMKNKKPAWDLSLDLAELSEDAWKELQSHHADLVTVSGTLTSISQKQLLHAPCYLTVFPRPQPYQVYREVNGHIKQIVKSAPETPGLNSGWQGNIFTESPRLLGIWRRRQPENSVSFWGELLWLARVEYRPEEWPGKTYPIGPAYVDWQLWRLTVDEDEPISWESVQKWFGYRSIYVSKQRQRLEIVSPPSAVTDDGKYLFQPNQQVLIACSPPSRFVHGIGKSLALLAEQINDPARSNSIRFKVVSVSVLADQLSYFHWSAANPGEYRIRIQGDATAEPLLIQVAALPPVNLRWLHGLSCMITSERAQHTFHAFDETSGVEAEKDLYELFTLSELPRLGWTYEPKDLPIKVAWNYESFEGARDTGSANFIQSEEELTRYWKEQIWPAITASASAKIALDAGNFGSIELSFAVATKQTVETAWWTDERLAGQFIWLSRMTVKNPSQKCVTMPASLRNSINQLRLLSGTNPSLGLALEKLATTNMLPAWIFFRVQTLLVEVQRKVDYS